MRNKKQGQAPTPVGVLPLPPALSVVDQQSTAARGQSMQGTEEGPRVTAALCCIFTIKHCTRCTSASLRPSLRRVGRF